MDRDPRRPVLVTGGAGFIGANFVRLLVQELDCRVISLDSLSYAGNCGSLIDLESNARYTFVRGEIGDRELVRRILTELEPWAVVHLAAETHVDRSIVDPGRFVETNFVGTYALLEEARRYWANLRGDLRSSFRFLSVSTDEVFGALGEEGRFNEETRYDPSSPYSATKAGADHLVRAYNRTFGLPTIITNCSNNYGPYQHPEKLIPLSITRALAGEALPIYGSGRNVRDWLFVKDHCEALWRAVCEGAPGQTYAIGGGEERRNLEVVQSICDQLETLVPSRSNPSLGGRRYQELITFVIDRPGHDYRYAIDPSRIQRELGWRARESFETGLRRTIEWYLAHQDWVRSAASPEHDQWIAANYGSRLEHGSPRGIHADL